jgi:hydrogenase maturation factor
MTTVSSVKGTVTEFEWSNPHAYIHIDVVNDKGKPEKWTAELASLGMLSRVNWKRDTVKPGDVISMVGNRAKSGTNYMRLNKIVFANGQELSAEVR